MIRLTVAWAMVSPPHATLGSASCAKPCAAAQQHPQAAIAMPKMPSHHLIIGAQSTAANAAELRRTNAPRGTRGKPLRSQREIARDPVQKPDVYGRARAESYRQNASPSCRQTCAIDLRARPRKKEPAN